MASIQVKHYISLLRSVLSEIEVLQSIYLDELLVNRKEEGWDKNELKWHQALALRHVVSDLQYETVGQVYLLKNCNQVQILKYLYMSIPISWNVILQYWITLVSSYIKMHIITSYQVYRP